MALGVTTPRLALHQRLTLDLARRCRRASCVLNSEGAEASLPRWCSLLPRLPGETVGQVLAARREARSQVNRHDAALDAMAQISPRLPDIAPRAIQPNARGCLGDAVNANLDFCAPTGSRRSGGSPQPGVHER